MTSADGRGVYLTHEDMDREVVAQAVRAMEWARRRGDGLVLSVEEVAALLAERDRLREALEELILALQAEAGEIDRKLAVKSAISALKGDQT